MSGHTDGGGKLWFKYKNLSGRDIQSISLHISGRMQVSGPAGPSFLDTSQDVTANGPMLANASKKTSVKLPPGGWNGLQVELQQVKFNDGELWINDGNLECVLNPRTGYRH
jgi:hypothetical protein